MNQETKKNELEPQPTNNEEQQGTALWKLYTETEEKIKHLDVNSAQRRLLARASILLHKSCSKSLSSTEKREIEKHLEEAALIPCLGISDSERVMIVKAMNLGPGHWFKCPNGHVYAIGECGGATHESICNECGAPIGGGSHKLLETNNHATEMDGSQHPAWSEATGLGNYDLRDLV